MPKLKHRMLLATTGMIRRAIRHRALTPKQPAAARTKHQRLERRFAAEDEEPPAGRGGWEAGVAGLVVFEYDVGAVGGVAFGREFARGGEVGLLFCGRRGLVVEGGGLGGEGGFGAQSLGRFVG